MHLFYQELLTEGYFRLENEEYHHCIGVLRHKTGDEIHVTDGNGVLANCIIRKIDRKSLEFEVIQQEQLKPKSFRSSIAIAPTKQMDRMEWFVEKACEMGVDEIHFLHTKNSERPGLKLDRLEKKAVSALKQSKGGFRTKLFPMTGLEEFIKNCTSEVKLLAAVNPENKYITTQLKPRKSITLLIGPEGDFTPNELKICEMHNFQPVSLGVRVLRTETAGIVAAQFINSANSY